MYLTNYDYLVLFYIVNRFSKYISINNHIDLLLFKQYIFISMYNILRLFLASNMLVCYLFIKMQMNKYFVIL